MDRTLETLTALLLDPFLTTDEAQREAAATSWQARAASEPSTLRQPTRRRYGTAASADTEDIGAQSSVRFDLS